MKAKELRKLYIDYFTEKGHREIASSSLLPENDPSVLFTTAGMHPLVPYLLGVKHPLGKRVTGVQKCIRTGDIDEVGDAFHLTFFEMLGNWSFGDYFKTESISMSYEFLTSRLRIPAGQLAVTVFAGDGAAPRDRESYRIWRALGLGDAQIFFYSREENWWGPAGITGPCGPDTEIFIDTGKEKCGADCGPACRCGKYVEIWNNVFMEYNKNAGGTYVPLPQKNVDTGMGFERVLALLNGVDSVYQTELFLPLLQKIEVLTGLPAGGQDIPQARILCDHVRAAVFILGDERKIVPSNTEQGYILRRLLRRAIRHGKNLCAGNILPALAAAVIDYYGETYPELRANQGFILAEIGKESAAFDKTLASGLKKAAYSFTQIGSDGLLSGDTAFKLYDTFGFPVELTQELAKEKGYAVDLKRFTQKFKEHQLLSRRGAAQKFKGGMADHSEQTTKLHTATHLLHGALRRVLGDTVLQRGSNITPERLRFDFSFGRKVTAEELARVEEIVNAAITRDIAVDCAEMTAEEAKGQGAIGIFDDRYGDKVKVYTISGYSKEICGGPHASRTGALGSFKIIREESASAGVRRIKALLSPVDSVEL